MIEGIGKHIRQDAIAADADAVFDQLVVGRRKRRHRGRGRACLSGRWRDRRSWRRAHGQIVFQGGVRPRQVGIDPHMGLVELGNVAHAVAVSEDRFAQRRLKPFRPAVRFARHRPRLHQRIACRRLKSRVGLFSEASLLNPVE